MSKKVVRRTTTTSNYPTVRVCAFWGVILSGICGLIAFIINLLDKIFERDDWGFLSKISGVLSLISNIAIFIAIWLAGWDYVKTKTKGWRVVFIIFFILALLGIFGISLTNLLWF